MTICKRDILNKKRDGRWREKGRGEREGKGVERKDTCVFGGREWRVSVCV